ncbi:MAG: M48 family metallopeptidase [Planctomycetota bacterium]
MHLLTIVAFACLFWRSDASARWVLVPDGEVSWTLLIALAPPLVCTIVAFWAARRADAMREALPDGPQSAHLWHHRATSFLRVFLLLGFAAAVMLTHWPTWFAFGQVTPALQVFGDVIVLSPYLAGAVGLLLAAYPIERAFRFPFAATNHSESTTVDGSWSWRSYLDFNVRHHVLVVAVPMLLILFASDMTRGYEAAIRKWTGFRFAPDVLLGLFSAAVFLVAPWMLCRIWRTSSLQAGPLRERLEAICRGIGLRCRDILVWQSDGILINAAVMGLFPRVRYVLLSDALLATMSPRQVEAVFGHEAGHVRHRHIEHFLLFAFAGWAVVAATMELLSRAGDGLGASSESTLAVVEAAGVVGTLGVWGIGFGWLSRRFERQADLFGARCVTPKGGECNLPCSVHPDECTTVEQGGRVCATAAAVFASALERVASLNGIPWEENSWRHASIGYRARFLRSLAGDPARAIQFERTITRIKRALLLFACLSVVTFAWYWWTFSESTLLRLQAGIR